MNKLTKIGASALAGSLVAFSANAAEMSVSGSAAITFSDYGAATSNNAWAMGDGLTFSASGETDGGLTMSVSQVIDNGILDDMSISISTDAMGTVTLHGKDGSSALGAVDDVMPTAYGESWDVIGFGSTSTSLTTGQTAKEGAIGGFVTNNSFYYTAPAMVDGLSVDLSYMPSGAGRPDGTVSYALAYTGVEGLTLGYAADDNGLSGTSKLETETMYAKYAFGSFTVGVQTSEQDGGNANDDDEFSAHGVTYQVSDDLTIGYHASERQFGDKSADQETKSIQASYTMGGMTLKAQSVSADNQGGSTASRDDVDGYKLSVSFAF